MMDDLVRSSLFAAVLAVALVHAVLPTHWLSFVMVARAQKWGRGRMLRIVLVSGLGHVTTTAVVGLLAAALGKDLLGHAHEWETPFPALILLAFGLYYLVSGWRKEGHRHCTHDHRDDPILPDRVAAGALFLEMTLSPCESLIPIFFAAGGLAWPQLIGMAVLSSLITIGAMGLLAGLAHAGYTRIAFPWLEANERIVLALILLVLGGVSYFLH